MKCPECGFENLAERAHCHQCGWLLAVMPARAAVHKESASIIVLEHAPSSSGSNGREPSAAWTGDVAARVGPENPPDEALLWRQEVSRRVHAYRARRRRHIEGQEDFPFAHGDHEPEGVASSNRVTLAIPRPRPREPNRIELPILQPMLAFEDAEPQPVPTLEPPAAARERLRAGLLDAGIVLASYLGFFALFAGLGHELPLDKVGFAIYSFILVFFFTAYLFLFTAFGGRTPGMRLVGLELVRFDGAAPNFEDALWRTAGYLVSAGSFFLGFIWIFVDSKQLTWHDRISKTFLIATRQDLEEAA